MIQVWLDCQRIYLFHYRYICLPLPPLFGKFHSPLKAAGRTLCRRPLHHLESLCAQRIDPRLLQPNPTGDNSRQRIYTPKLTFLAFLQQTLDPDSSCRIPRRSIPTLVPTARRALAGPAKN